MEFGTPLAEPVFGCLTVVKPSSSTGSSTGHIAFFVENEGGSVWLIGGNQVHGTKVSKSRFKRGDVLAYRWPTQFNYYLVARKGVQV